MISSSKGVSGCSGLFRLGTYPPKQLGAYAPKTALSTKSLGEWEWEGTRHSVRLKPNTVHLGFSVGQTIGLCRLPASQEGWQTTNHTIDGSIAAPERASSISRNLLMNRSISAASTRKLGSAVPGQCRPVRLRSLESPVLPAFADRSAILRFLGRVKEVQTPEESSAVLWTLVGQMRLYDLQDREGRVFAFEVNNFFCGRSRVCQIASTIPGARIIRTPKWLSWFREEVFCEFDLDGVTFVAWEPYGDNSRYWIGPEPTRWVPQIESVREAFSHA